ncbi:DUF1834 family protein [Acinetobacter haemolyticus]|nr:DUF1834 family protein [Acinetobacter haemolyticus]
MDLSAIEQGIKDAIKSLDRKYIAAIETYGGEFDEDLAAVVRRFPAVWTTFGSAGKPEQLSARKFRVPLVFVTLVGARSLRNEEAARHGLTENGQLVSVGTFQLLQDVQLALLNNNLAAHGVRGITHSLSERSTKFSISALRKQRLAFLHSSGIQVVSSLIQLLIVTLMYQCQIGCRK